MAYHIINARMEGCTNTSKLNSNGFMRQQGRGHHEDDKNREDSIK
jgi:hypothetical protein